MPKTKKPVNEEFVVFAKRLRELRESQNMTQAEFSKMTRFTQATLSAYENSLKVPSLDIVMSIASKCEVSIDWLCGLTDKRSSQEKIETYSDFIQAILPILNNVASCIEDVNLDLYDRKFDTEKIESSKYTVSSLCFLDKKIRSFFNEYINIKNLLANGTIDKEMFDIWIEKSLRKYDEKIVKEGDYSTCSLFELPF